MSSPKRDSLVDVDQPEPTLREYLNMKRSSKNKCCLVFFCIYMLIVLMITGLALFYGNYSLLGVLICSGSHAKTSNSTNNTNFNGNNLPIG